MKRARGQPSDPFFIDPIQESDFPRRPFPRERPAQFVPGTLEI